MTLNKACLNWSIDALHDQIWRKDEVKSYWGFFVAKQYPAIYLPNLNDQLQRDTV